MMRLRYAPAAALDLEGIYARIAADDGQAAVRVIANIRHLALLLAEHPGMGLAAEVPPAFKITVPGLPYKIIYQADEPAGELIILRVYHGARNLSF